jgi:hypothetical protein
MTAWDEKLGQFFLGMHPFPKDEQKENRLQVQIPSKMFNFD